MAYEDLFRSPEHAAQFRAAYHAVLDLWTMPHDSLDITTSYGTTHVNVAGSPDAPPLILLHGNQASSPAWYANVAALSKHFRLYAPDVIDQMGLSSPTGKLATREDYAKWLTEILDSLNLQRVSIIGHSHGGWQALNMAIAHPERVESLVLLAPAPAFVGLRMTLLLRMLPVFVRPTRGTFYWNFQWLTTMPLDKDQPHPLIEQFMVGAMSYKPGQLSFGVISVYKDDELNQIKMPVLLLIGEKEVIYSPKRVLERARRTIPHIEAELIANGGHLFPVDQADVTNKRILEFFNCG